jgi:uncharacterized membrane protein
MPARERQMTTTKFFLRTLIVAVAMFALGFVGHQFLLGRDYTSVAPIMWSKQDMQAHMTIVLHEPVNVAFLHASTCAARLAVGPPPAIPT